MQHLAEVRKQTKTFMGGNLKTELKLLARQDKDEIWVSIPGEKVVFCESLSNLGEGALVFVDIGGNDHIQGDPQLAGAKLARQLQNYSTRIEDFKKKEKKIKDWEMSLNSQIDLINEREQEIMILEEQLQAKEIEFEQILEQRRELEEEKENLKREQEQVEELRKNQVNVFGKEQAVKIQNLFVRLNVCGLSTEGIREQLNMLFAEVDTQQANLNHNWQNLEQQKIELQTKQQEINYLSEQVKNRKHELDQLKDKLQQANQELLKQQTNLERKQDLLQRVKLEQETHQNLQKTILNQAFGTVDLNNEQKENILALYSIPLEDLQAKVNEESQELAKQERYLNDLEEELSFELEMIRELEEKLKTANEYDRLTFEQDLADAKERERALESSFHGQQVPVTERQQLFEQYQRVLQWRKTMFDGNQDHGNIDIRGILEELKQQEENDQQELQKVENEIDQIRQNLQRLQETITQQTSLEKTKEKELHDIQQHWQQLEIVLLKLESVKQFKEEALPSIQNGVNVMREKLLTIEKLLEEVKNTSQEHHETLANLQNMLGDAINSLSQTTN